MRNDIKYDLLNQIRKPGITKQELERAVYTLLPVCRVYGKIGKWDIRWYRGKAIISRRPDFVNISQTEASILNRQSLAAATKLAISLNNIPILKEVWSTAKLDGNCAYRKLIKYNKKRLINNNPSLSNSLTPEGGHFEVNEHITFDGKNSINIKKTGNSNPDDIIICVLVPCEPKQSGMDSFEIIKICDTPLSSDTVINLTPEQLDIVKKYQSYFLYSAIIRMSGSDIIWSDTLVTEGKLLSEKLIEYPAEHSRFFYLIFTSEAPVRNFITRKKAHPPPGIISPLHFCTAQAQGICYY